MVVEARRIRSKKPREHQYREGYVRSLERKSRSLVRMRRSLVREKE